jgi:hypothetical protein
MQPLLSLKPVLSSIITQNIFHLIRNLTAPLPTTTTIPYTHYCHAMLSNFQCDQLRDVAAVSIKQADLLRSQTAVGTRELASLRAQLLDLQGDTDERAMLGSLHRQLIAMQVGLGLLTPVILTSTYSFIFVLLYVYKCARSLSLIHFTDVGSRGRAEGSRSKSTHFGAGGGCVAASGNGRRS